MNLSILQNQFAPQMPTDCVNLSCDPNFSSSLGIFLLALGASEFVVYLVCRWMAYYANNAFYSQSLEWIHSDTTISPENEQEDITEALHVSEYAYSCREVSEPCCPICLIDYGKFKHVLQYWSTHALSGKVAIFHLPSQNPKLILISHFFFSIQKKMTE